MIRNKYEPKSARFPRGKTTVVRSRLTRRVAEAARHDTRHATCDSFPRYRSRKISQEMSDQQKPRHENGSALASSSGPLRRREFQRVPSATSLIPPTSDQGLTANDLIAHQALLESQAREAIPFSYSLASCTYEKGYIRQPLFACRDCGGGAVCAGCSIGCHAEHDLIELFAKRHSRCDCGCPSLQRTRESQNRQLKPCNLRKAPLNFAPENDENVYGKNHEGHFCYCEKGYTYNPHEEEETMFQCLVCEDWFHETCTSLRPRGEERTQGKDDVGHGDDHDDDDDRHPPPLISHEDFDTFICDACVRENPILHRYVGVQDWGACLRFDRDVDADAGEPSTTVVEVAGTKEGLVRYAVRGLASNEEYGHGRGGTRDAHVPVKRERELSPIEEGGGGGGGDGDGDGDSDGQPGAKRVKAETSTNAGDVREDQEQDMLAASVAPAAVSQPSAENGDVAAPTTTPPGCSLPPIHPLVQRLLSRSDAASTADSAPHANNPDNRHRPSHRLDVFLSEGGGGGGEGGKDAAWRQRICRCKECLLGFARLPFLLAEEYTYSPPASVNGGGENDAAGDDDDATSNSSHSTTYDLGMNALNRLPRAQTLEALEGYGRLRSALFDHLRPFAESGRAVDEESIRAFFEEQRRRDREARG